MDMLRYHKFTIGWAWKGDYGSSEDEINFRNLLAYSPLHNIRSGVNYPATLVTTGDHDDRVVPAHSFKFISTLQDIPSNLVCDHLHHRDHEDREMQSRCVELILQVKLYVRYDE